MSKEKIYIFDTTLRDGAQTQGVDFSIDDKLKIAKALDDLGVDYIEGGWPGAIPTDTEFFQKKINLNNSVLTAFGMTKRIGRSADNDPGLSSILNSNTPAVCLVGKSWDFHVDVALGISNEENLENISESAKLFVKEKKEFMFDAEHFFDGFKNNKKYALSCIKSAYDNGARWIVLCDTNGGTLPNEVSEIVNEVTKSIPGKNLGIHAHNDTGNAVANSLVAVLSGVRQIQGTINGLGERCGNANLMSVIPSLILKESFAKNFEIGISKNKGDKIVNVNAIEAIKGRGLVGEKHFKKDNNKRCQITLIEVENIDYYNKITGTRIPAINFLRNIVTEGIQLNVLLGKEFFIGAVKVKAHDLCRPCKNLQESLQQKNTVKELLHTGGLRCEILSNGKICVDDQIIS